MRTLLLLLLLPATGSSLPTRALAAPPLLRPAPAAIRASASSAANGELISAHAAARMYRLLGGATSAAWVCCSVAALATYKPHRVLHNAIGVAQACTALPLVWTTTESLARTVADNGWEALGDAQPRSLNLGLAAASAWCAVTAAAAPAFTAAVVRTSDPVRYPMPLVVAACAVHAATALWSLLARRRPRPAPSHPDEPTAATRAEGLSLRLLALTFGGFSACAIFAPFPLATVPSLLGKRLARAFAAWLGLAAVSLHALSRAGVAGGGGGAGPLADGLALHAASHLAVAVARAALESPALYPAAMACRPAVAASLLAYALAWRASSRARAPCAPAAGGAIRSPPP